MIVKFWTYVEDLGDGSACTRVFSSEKKADKFMSFEDCPIADNLEMHELEFDDQGHMITPDDINYNDPEFEMD